MKIFVFRLAFILSFHLLFLLGVCIGICNDVLPSRYQWPSNFRNHMCIVRLHRVDKSIKIIFTAIKSSWCFWTIYWSRWLIVLLIKVIAIGHNITHKYMYNYLHLTQKRGVIYADRECLKSILTYIFFAWYVKPHCTMVSDNLIVQ